MIMRFLALPLLGFLSLSAAENAPVTVGARNVSVKIADTSDPDYVTLSISFDALVQGQDRKDLQLAASPVFLVRGDRFTEGEGWTTMYNALPVDTVPPEYMNCTALRNGEAFGFPHVTANALLKKTDKEAHSRATFRFRLVAACLASGKLVQTHLVTEPIEANIPQW